MEIPSFAFFGPILTIFDRFRPFFHFLSINCHFWCACKILFWYFHFWRFLKGSKYNFVESTNGFMGSINMIVGSIKKIVGSIKKIVGSIKKFVESTKKIVGSIKKCGSHVAPIWLHKYELEGSPKRMQRPYPLSKRYNAA